MDPMYTLKFSFQRPQLLAQGLIHTHELTLLGAIAATEYSGFYLYLFQVLAFKEWLTYYFFLSLLVFNIIISLALMLTLVARVKKLACLVPALSAFIKLFPYLLSIAALNTCLLSVFDTNTEMMIKLTAIANLPFFIAYLLLHQYINQSLKFRESDYCNRRVCSNTDVLLVPIALLLLHMLGPFYACISCSLRAAYSLLTLFSHNQYTLPQKLSTFYALFTFYFTFLLFLTNFNIIISRSTFSAPHITLVVLLAGALASWTLSSQLVAVIWKKMLGMARGSVERSEDESYDSDEPPLSRVQNEITILVQALIEREKSLNHQENNYSHFWRQFSQVVFLHKLHCSRQKCLCKGSRKYSEQQIQNELFVQDLLHRLSSASEMLGKQMQLKVLNIYLLIQIAKKPLKGYYKLIMLKKEKINSKLQMEIDQLVSISRECFDQIFYKNKVQNQQLNLLKVIHSEQMIKELEDQLKLTLTTSSAFLDIFTYSTLKLGQVQTEADRILRMKKQIQRKVEHLVTDCYENPSVLFSIFVFYRFLQPYRSRQTEFKKLAGQTALKKRLLFKAEGQNLSSQDGIIYIDLVQQRGKIKKITRSVGDLFGYSKQDMIGFNINLFMPTIFGKNHAKFLSNFIDKGRIKLLKQKDRVIFAKNKKKFIFPVNIRLKAEHLLNNQFGASALLSAVDTNSDYILIGKNGRIEEITQNLYDQIFGKTLKDQVFKTSRVCAYKLLLGINQIMEGFEEKQASKIHEGLLIYPIKEEYLFEKFRHTRDSTLATMGGRSKSSSISLLSSSSASIPLHSQSERFDYYSDLFKVFLSDINPSMLKAFKVSYKYSRVKTAQFQIELIEIISTREQIVGKDFLRELVSQLNNVAQIYQLLEEQSPLSQHLYELEENIQRTVGRVSKDLSQSGVNFSLKMNQNGHKREPLASQAQIEEDNYYHQDSHDSFDQQPEQKDLALHHGSETGSVAGTTQTQSKKQLLINAFNGSQQAISTPTIVGTVLVIVILFAFLIAMALIQLGSIDESIKLWKESSYILKLRLVFQFRLSQAEIMRFSNNLNITTPASLTLQQQQLNNHVSLLAKSLISHTFNNHPIQSPFLFSMPLTDPANNMVYQGGFPSAVNHLTHLFTTPSLTNNNTLRYNYENYHKNLSNFFEQRSTFYQSQFNRQQFSMTSFLVLYQVLIGLIALSAIPIYIYFKRQEISVRSKLAYMNQREVKRSIHKFSLILDYFKEPITKTTLNRLQYDLADKKQQKDQQFIGGKVVKLSAQSEDYKVFSSPWTYAILLLFIIFFSNLAVGLFTTFNTSNTFFVNALEAHRLANELQIKSPMLINVYLSNLNRALQNTTLKTYTVSTHSQTENGYFDLINTLSLPKYHTNSIAEQLKTRTTTNICLFTPCGTIITNQSLQDISQSFKHKFDYWRPSNNIAPTQASITHWLVQNSIQSLLANMALVLELAIKEEEVVDTAFSDSTKWLWMTVLLLTAILLPVNLVGLTLILRKYLMNVNRMVRSAQQLFMQFPVNVLVENTYLTSYFNTKVKSGK